MNDKLRIKELQDKVEYLEQENRELFLMSLVGLFIAAMTLVSVSI